MRFILVITFAVQAIFSFGQITFDTHELNFGDVVQGSPKTLSFTVTNHYQKTINVQVHAHQSDFKVDQNTASIASGKSVEFKLTFDPTHNIDYNTEVVVTTDTRSGAHRIDVTANGKYKEAYYASTEDLWHEDLKAELKSIIAKNYVNLGYNGARDKMYGDIDNHGGVVECVYTGRTATFNSRSGANSNSFNCEHTWPQSLFNSNEPERADIHHLFPTDVTANGKRANYAFGSVSSSSWSVGGSKLGSGVFEPRDEHKGDVARAMFYFCLRYSNYSNFLTNQETTLRGWHSSFPPDSNDSLRNEKIFSYQKNRNPFVDHPEFLERIASISQTFTPSGGSSNLYYTVTSIDLGAYPDSDTSVYQFILVNRGDVDIEFTSTSLGKPEFSTPTNAFTITPGEAQVIRITLKADKTLGKISDTLHLISTNSNHNLHIPVTGTIDKLGAVYNRDLERLELWGNTLQVHADPGSTLSLFDITGVQISLNEISSSFTEISLSNLNTGPYFAVLNSKDGSRRVLKFLKQPD